MSEARRRKVTLVQKSEDNVVFDKKAKNVILSPAKTPVFKQAEETGPEEPKLKKQKVVIQQLEISNKNKESTPVEKNRKSATAVLPSLSSSTTTPTISTTSLSTNNTKPTPELGHSVTLKQKEPGQDEKLTSKGRPVILLGNTSYSHTSHSLAINAATSKLTTKSSLNVQSSSKSSSNDVQLSTKSSLNVLSSTKASQNVQSCTKPSLNVQSSIKPAILNQSITKSSNVQLSRASLVVKPTTKKSLLIRSSTKSSPEVQESTKSHLVKISPKPLIAKSSANPSVHATTKAPLVVQSSAKPSLYAQPTTKQSGVVQSSSKPSLLVTSTKVILSSGPVTNSGLSTAFPKEKSTSVILQPISQKVTAKPSKKLPELIPLNQRTTLEKQPNTVADPPASRVSPPSTDSSNHYMVEPPPSAFTVKPQRFIQFFNTETEKQNDDDESVECPLCSTSVPAGFMNRHYCAKFKTEQAEQADHDSISLPGFPVTCVLGAMEIKTELIKTEPDSELLEEEVDPLAADTEEDIGEGNQFFEEVFEDIAETNPSLQEEWRLEDATLSQQSSLPCRTQCRTCNLKVMSMNVLDHFKIFHRSSLVPTNQDCPFCQRSFSSDYQTIRHIENTHQKLKAKCNICGVRFINLRAHQEKYHTMKNVGKCKLCNKVVKHLNSHNCPLELSESAKDRNRATVCPNCGNEVKEKYLRIHQKSHCVGSRSSTFSNFRTEGKLLENYRREPEKAASSSTLQLRDLYNPRVN